jgi:hypothetical protein
MTTLLEEAIAKVTTLPPATQEKIGEELIAHVEKLERLRLIQSRSAHPAALAGRRGRPSQDRRALR